MGRKDNNMFWTFVRFYRESRLEEGFHLSMDQACREATKIWAQMPAYDKELFREDIGECRLQSLGAGGDAGAAGHASAAGPGRPAQQAMSKPRSKLTGRERRYLRGIETQRLNYVESIECFEQHVFSLACIRPVRNGDIPCEMTVVRFSVQGGVHSYFHAVLNPEIVDDEYASFREANGDIANVVRIKDTPNSIQNRHDLRKALIDYCEGRTLLVPSCNLDDAVNGMRYFNCDDPNPAFEIIDGQDVFFNLSQRIQHFRLPKWRIARHVDAFIRNERFSVLRCNFHRKLTRFGCSLSSCLSFAYALGDLFPDELKADKKPVADYFKPGTRPEGLHYRGSGVGEEDCKLNDSWDY